MAQKTKSKYRLTPQLAYVIGLWKARKTGQGIGVSGKCSEVFVEEAIKQRLTKPNKMIVREACAYFYHSKLRDFFEEVEKDGIEIFKEKNEKSANFLAGFFDGSGEIRNGFPIFHRLDLKTSFIIERLGFRIKKIRQEGKSNIYAQKDFLIFVKPYLKIIN